MHIQHTQFILYVKNQDISTEFYSVLFNTTPDLHVPGMTEFILNPFCKLGLMPNEGIAKIITPILPHPDSGIGIPRCELYLKVDNLKDAYKRALLSKAGIVSDIKDRSWGDTAFYCTDPDGHVIAFAQK